MGKLTHFPRSQCSLSTGAWKLLPRSPPRSEGAVYGLGKGNRTQMLFMLGINTFPPYLFLPSEDRHAPGLGH